MKKIITCTGYHGTGSSVITDYLKEFNSIDSKGEFEFRFIQDPNGIADLEDSLIKNNSRLNSDRAIFEYIKLIKRLNSNYSNRFWKKSIYRITFKEMFLKISLEYIDDLVDFEWNGYWHDFDTRNNYFLSRLKKILKKILEYFFCEKNKFSSQKMYYSYPIEDFNTKTKKYLKKLFQVSSKKEIIAFDQLVPCCNINRYLNYFDNIKVVVVDRDPRDLYILNKEIWKDKTVPCQNVEVFIKHYKLLRKHQKYEDEDQENILRIRFEDAIYNYDIFSKKIKKFLKIEELEHTNPKKYFKPEESIKNTQLFKVFLEYSSDISKIEKELPEFCYKYPFSLDREGNKIKKIY